MQRAVAGVLTPGATGRQGQMDTAKAAEEKEVKFSRYPTCEAIVNTGRKV